MTSEPLRVEPVEVGYYQDGDSAVGRIVWYMAMVGILYGAFNALTAGMHLLAVLTGLDFWARSPTWYSVLAMVGGVLAVLLLLSGVGCLTQRRAARTGMLVYAYLAITMQMFTLGVYVMQMVRNGGAMGLSSSMMETTMMALSYVSWMVQGCLFPVLVLVVFRMKEVARLFAK